MQHYIYDVMGADFQRAYHSHLIRQLLLELAEAIGMTVLEGPITTLAGGPPDKMGVTGFVIIAESHISIHTYPCLGQVYCDVFSCKAFDQSMVLDMLLEAFDASHCVMREVPRVSLQAETPREE